MRCRFAALEAIGETRRRLVQSNVGAPRKPEDGKKAERPQDPLAKGVRAAVPGLAEKLTDKNLNIRLACLYALEAFDQEAAPAAEKVVLALADKNLYVRWAAVRVLGRIAPLQAAKVVPQLTRLLKDRNQYIKITTLAALERYGPKAKGAVKALAAAGEKGNSEVQVWAIRALVAVGTAAKKEATPVLVAALAAKEVQVRQAAASALAKFGPPKGKVQEALREALTDPHAEVRQAASDALLVDK
jgi:HEAT repeat protein